MIRYLLITASAIAFAGATFPVAAADLSRGPVMPMAYPTYNWTGVYLGLNGGGGWGSQDPLNIITDRFDRFNVSISGGMFGGTSGAQVQVSHVVLGLESDLDWADITGSGTVAPSALVERFHRTDHMRAELPVRHSGAPKRSGGEPGIQYPTTEITGFRVLRPSADGLAPE